MVLVFIAVRGKGGLHFRGIHASVFEVHNSTNGSRRASGDSPAGTYPRHRQGENETARQEEHEEELANGGGVVQGVHRFGEAPADMRKQGHVR